MINLPTLRQLRYLVTLADHLNFTKAAEICAVTQSTLSAGIAEMEAQLDAALVDRSTRSVVFTPLGEETVARARAILQAAEDLAVAARAAAEPLTGTIRLGVIPTIGPFLLPRVLPALRERYPKLKLFLREEQTARLLHLLETGEIDVALLALPFPGLGPTQLLFGDPFVLACKAEDSLASKAAVTGEDLIARDLLLLEDGHCLREHALAACALDRTPQSEMVRATSLHTLVQMVDNGLGITLLPRLAIEGGILGGTALVTVPLAGNNPARGIGLTWRGGSRRADEFRMLGEILIPQPPRGSGDDQQAGDQKHGREDEERNPIRVRRRSRDRLQRRAV
jgi:LysR family hydrogen peroxide-inducible transcriptional activator